MSRPALPRRSRTVQLPSPRRTRPATTRPIPAYWFVTSRSCSHRCDAATAIKREHGARGEDDRDAVPLRAVRVRDDPERVGRSRDDGQTESHEPRGPHAIELPPARDRDGQEGQEHRPPRPEHRDRPIVRLAHQEAEQEARDAEGDPRRDGPPEPRCRVVDLREERREVGGHEGDAHHGHPHPDQRQAGRPLAQEDDREQHAHHRVPGADRRHDRHRPELEPAVVRAVRGGRRDPVQHHEAEDGRQRDQAPVGRHDDGGDEHRGEGLAHDHGRERAGPPTGDGPEEIGQSPADRGDQPEDHEGARASASASTATTPRPATEERVRFERKESSAEIVGRSTRSP